MSTELATIESANPLAYLGGVDGEPIKPVRLELTQPINASAEDGTIAGRFRDCQSNFQFEDLNLVVLEMRDGRVLFESTELGSKPLCKSDDGLQPKISDDLQRQDGNKGCAKCPMSQWKKIGGRNIKPACQETRTLLAAQLETGFTYRMNGKGVAVPVLKDLKETIKKFYRATAAKGRAILPTQIFFRLSSVKVQGKKGTYYIPKFGPPTPIEDPNQQQEMTDIHQRLVVNRKVNYADDADEPDQTEPTGSDPVGTVLEGHYEEA